MKSAGNQEIESGIVQYLQKSQEKFGIIVHLRIDKSMIKCIMQEIFIKIIKEEVSF